MSRREPVLEACEDCRFFVPSGQTAGTCHRHAPMQFTTDPIDEGPAAGFEAYEGPEDTPVVMTAFRIDSYFGWPSILRSDWCGEWEAKR